MASSDLKASSDLSERNVVAGTPKKKLAISVGQLVDDRLKVAARFGKNYRVERRAITRIESPLAARLDRALIESAGPLGAAFFMGAPLA